MSDGETAHGECLRAKWLRRNVLRLGVGGGAQIRKRRLMKTDCGFTTYAV